MLLTCFAQDGRSWPWFSLLSCWILASPALSDSPCYPPPKSIRIGNVSLSNSQVARGVELSVGTPSQSFAFLPQWELNHTFVYGTNGFCSSSMSTSACTTFRGGQYSPISSTTRKTVASDVQLENSPYPLFDLVNDTLTITDNVSVNSFPVAISLSDWGEQGYHPQMAIGLGANSTFLTTLKSSGKIASRVWSFFWGLTGDTSRTQLDGSLVLGGYDKAKVQGQNYTEPLSTSSQCSTRVLVTISNIVVNFPNGTDASLFSGQSTALKACIVPDYPALMTIPTDPYFNTFQELTNTSIVNRSFGLNYYTMLYSPGDIPFGGDMTISFDTGLSIRIPNDQMVVHEVTISSTSGELVANSSAPNLVILPIQNVNANDLMQLGRHFLSSAYLMVNQETESFTLWQANPTSNEELTVIDGTGVEREGSLNCTVAIPDATPSPGGGGVSTQNPNSGSGISKGAIAGIAVGSVAAGILATALLLLLRSRRKTQAERKQDSSNSNRSVSNNEDMLGRNRGPSELPSSSPAVSRSLLDLEGTGLSPSPLTKYSASSPSYELAG